MYGITRENCTGSTEYAEFWVLSGETLLDKLPEVIYILWEEELLSRNWWQELQSQGYTRLTYHGLEFSTLTYNEGCKGFVIVED